MYAKKQHNILLCEAHYRKQKHSFRKNYSQPGGGREAARLSPREAPSWLQAKLQVWGPQKEAASSSCPLGGAAVTHQPAWEGAFLHWGS